MCGGVIMHMVVRSSSHATLTMTRKYPGCDPMNVETSLKTSDKSREFETFYESPDSSDRTLRADLHSVCR